MAPTHSIQRESMMHIAGNSSSILRSSFSSSFVRTSLQPITVVGFQRPPPNRSTSSGNKQQQARRQQQLSRRAAPPKPHQTASSKSSSSKGRNQQDMLEAAKVAVDKFVCRHDPFTVGFGCLLVTGYCVVAHGQDVGEALQLAGFATILGMVSSHRGPHTADHSFSAMYRCACSQPLAAQQCCWAELVLPCLWPEKWTAA
eukprot:GHRQ01014330.1.p1 GENE.GHRQ01014330.1~~GHRQ01014330.1.p1  ORF type:complete len:200 (+),score=38.56 GHRQ01014330.1:216-815(+)